MEYRVKATFSQLQRNHAGRVLIQLYGSKGDRKCLTFSPLAEPVASEMKCSCGLSEWNATNFGNAVHFCPDREIEVIVTDYFASRTNH